MSNFGIDLLLESQKANIKDKNDILVILLHWMLCKNNLRNVGVGDSEEDRPSELLPEGWNTAEDNKYQLRYTQDKKIYVLHAIVTGDTLLINLLDGKTLKTESLVFEVNKIVKSTKGVTLDDFITDSAATIKRIESELVNPIIKKTEPAREEGETSQNPLLVQPQRPRIPPFYDGGRGFAPDLDPLRDIGRGDLDPFGRGGGMIFQPDLPFRPGGIHPLGPRPLGLPPGARYDPPHPFGRLNPEPDHFQPPGAPPPGYDDMFM